MTQQKSDEVRLALKKVWRSARPEALRRLATLEHFIASLSSGSPDTDSWKSALSAAHRLSGSLGMFGLEEASSCAAKIEAALGDGPAADVATTAGLVELLRTLLEATQASSGEPEEHGS